MEEEILNFQSQEFLRQKGSFKRKIFVLGGILVLMLVGGLSAVLASRIWDPLWNPFRPQPEKVIEKMISEMEKVKTSQGKTNLSLNISPSQEGKIYLELNSQDKIDRTQPEKPKLDSIFDLSLSFKPKENPMGLKIALNGEAKTIEEISYLKLANIPDIPFLGMLGIDVSQIKNQWIKIDEESIIKFEESMGEGIWNSEMERKYKERAEKEKVMAKEIQEKIKKLLKENKIYLVKKELPDEKVGEIKVYHYLVNLNKETLIKIIPEIAKMVEQTMLQEYGFSFTIEEKELEEKIKEILDKVGEIKGDIWIGKKDYLLYRIKGEKSIDLSKFKEKGTILINLNLENSKFNQPMKIEAPQEYKDLSEILNSLLKGYNYKRYNKLRI